MPSRVGQTYIKSSTRARTAASGQLPPFPRSPLFLFVSPRTRPAPGIRPPPADAAGLCGRERAGERRAPHGGTAEGARPF
jgi:hypothetical protein